tara:strand:- start:28689 stop:29351 length:663 start_codon:yes stop_codon:yes gene_type:complete
MENTNINMQLKSLSAFYEKGDYDNVIDGFLKLRGELPKDIFHYNLGSAFTKKGEYGAGRYHLELALKNNYWRSPALKNIDSIKKIQSIRDVSNSKSLTDSVINNYDQVSTDVFAFISLSLILFSIFLIFKKYIARTSFILLLVFSTLPLGSKIYTSKVFKSAVLLEETKISEGPSKAFEINFDLKAGSKVFVSKESDGWFYIEYPQNMNGWVSAKKLGFL